MIKHYPIDITEEELDAFCKRWLISELALFGSITRDDFHAESDVDMLVTFKPEETWSLLDHYQMEQDLSALLHRKVDILTKRSVERNRNEFFRWEVLSTAEIVYES